MRFLLDAQLPPLLTKALKRAGHEAVHVYECGLLTASDLAIWRQAAKEKAVIITKDADFAVLRLHAGRGPAVVWLRVGNLSTEALVAAFKAALPEIIVALEAGEVLVEVR